MRRGAELERIQQKTELGARLFRTDAERVKMTFTPDTQEAIWQNMETGSAVNFVAGPEGPTYTYSFQPRDALVLMIRKNVR